MEEEEGCRSGCAGGPAFVILYAKDAGLGRQREGRGNMGDAAHTGRQRSVRACRRPAVPLQAGGAAEITEYHRVRDRVGREQTQPLAGTLKPLLTPKGPLSTSHLYSVPSHTPVTGQLQSTSRFH